VAVNNIYKTRFKEESDEKYKKKICRTYGVILIIKGLKQSIFEYLLLEKENGLRALLALTGLANESLKRLITVVRVSNNTEFQNFFTKKNGQTLKILTM
jgi:hypothetical protein